MRLAATLLLAPALHAQVLAPRPVDALRTGAFANPEVRESSGVARSHSLPRVLYTINDSGGEPTVFAFDSSGRDLGHWRIPGIVNVDWEAITVSPCPAASCIYIGDIGDNQAQREVVIVYRVREPAHFGVFRGVAEAGPLDLDSAEYRYPEGPRDAEAMWVGVDGSVFVVTKGRSGQVELFRIPVSAFSARDPVVAELVQTLPITPERRFGRWVTDAALAPDGQRVAVRTYTELYVFRLLAPGRLGEPRVCNVAGLEPQGEGVAWLDQERLILTSEAVAGFGAGPIHVVRCGA